jgi:3-oxoacyl-[acyl-carrier protein] reductase
MAQALAGKIVLVTGASRGIGAATAVALSAAGASVILAAREVARAEAIARGIREAGGRAAAIACDISDYGSCTGLVARARDCLGPIDTVINNAAIIGPIAGIAESDPAAWAQAIAVDLIGPYNVVRAMLPAMIEARSGTIVNVSSAAAERPLAALSAYCAAKAGLVMLTRAIALEAGSLGVRVIGFQPGSTDTGMHETIQATGRRAPQSLQPAEHPARAIVYLCTPEADDLCGTEISLYDPAFRRRLGLGPTRGTPH